jgi:hypothetical protein
MRKNRTPAQKRGENDSVSDNVVHPEKPWYEPSNKGPTAGGRGSLGSTVPRRPAAADRARSVSEGPGASDAGRARRRAARPATGKRVQAKIVRKTSGGVLRPTDASVKRSPRARRP